MIKSVAATLVLTLLHTTDNNSMNLVPLSSKYSILDISPLYYLCLLILYLIIPLTQYGVHQPYSQDHYSTVLNPVLNPLQKPVFQIITFPYHLGHWSTPYSHPKTTDSPIFMDFDCHNLSIIHCISTLALYANSSSAEIFHISSSQDWLHFHIVQSPTPLGIILKRHSNITPYQSPHL